MNKAWKVLAAAATTVALVAAPLSMATAEETPPPDAVVEVVVTEEVVATGEDIPTVVEEAPVVEVVEAPVVEVIAPAQEVVVPAPEVVAPVVETQTSNPYEPEEKWVFVCKYTGQPGVDEVLQGGQNPISVSVNALQNFVELGAFFADGQFRSVAIAWDEEKGDGQNNEPPITDCPPPDDGDEEVTATYLYWPPTCDEEGFLELGEDDGYHWNSEDNEDGTTTYTAIANDGFVLAEPIEFTAVNDLEQLTGEDCEVVILPPTVDITVDCLLDDEVTVVANNENDVTVPVTLYLDFNGDLVPDASEILQVVPGETVLHYNFAEDTTVGILVQFEGQTIFAEAITVDCAPNTEVYSVPTSFNAGDPAPTCETSAQFSLPPEVLAEGEIVYEDDEVTVWLFENVEISVWRDVPGEIFLQIRANTGYVLEGLSAAWDVNEEGTYAERTVILAEATGFQTTDPEAACYQTTTTPPPTVIPPGPASVPPVTPAALAATGMSVNPIGFGMGAFGMLVAGAAILIWRRVARS